MSDKRLVHRLHADIAIESEQRYYRVSTTMALSGSEISDHLYLRLLMFCLFYDESLRINANAESKEFPDLYTEDEALGVVIAIPAEHQLKRYLHQFENLHIVLFADELDNEAFRPHLFQQTNVWCLDRALVESLEAEDELNHHWSLSLTDDQLNVTTRRSSYVGKFCLWEGMRSNIETKLHLQR
ncbi:MULTISPECIES: YaeQ family protein [Corallincola]|uniref:YaeQ family protein n=2 Tax=Corallincola TaxID=1775176 RepID=A0ABY1WU22_9GAMM|nr:MULTISPECIES: YaeQ family protein [Corallincola]TAA48128.1 hypothetical protein EXY25_02490 [Corallincola spongiicola]TCI03192.1 hypothetical protein EZV61_09920 [Corallincola luteus]